MSRAREFADLASSSDAGGITGKNLIINGAMQVAQRGTSSTGLGSDTAANFIVDRTFTTSSSAGRYTASQNTVTDLPGFANSLKLECTTADTSIASGEYLLFQHRFEGQNLQQLKKGTSDAESVTFSFYVKGNATATYTAELYDYDNTRQFSQRFNVTTSWNRISLTYAGDTTGAYDDDNALSLILIIWLHAGSDYTSGTQNTAWGAAVNNQRANSSDTSFFDSTSRTFEITGMQLELGEQATPFEHRSIGDELARCQRYYIRRTAVDGTYTMFGAGMNATTTSSRIYVHFPVEMRAAPSLGTSANNTFSLYSGAVNPALTATTTINNPSTFGTTLTTTTTGLTQGYSAILMANNNTSAFLEFIAEL